MKEIIQTLIFFTPQIVLSIGCVMMALRGISGWGWMLYEKGGDFKEISDEQP